MGASEMASKPEPWHETVEHVSELELRLRAPSFAGLAEEAGRAMAELLLRGEPGAPTGEWRSFVIENSDRAALLVEWLNDLIYQAETHRWVATEFRAELTGIATLRVKARGTEVEQAPSFVKAATFHGLRLRDTEGGVEAEVILDI
jgi:SHS2 domain-containing protein